MRKVSVIVPVYNVEKYLDKCLNSLVNQTLEDIEIIVVNDASPDNSQKIIDEYVKKYPNKVFSYIKENGGVADARNYGITKSFGEYIGFVDSDDYVDVNMYKSMYEKAVKDKSDIVICNFLEVRNGKNTEFDGFRNYNFKDNVKNYILGFPCPWNKLIKRELIIENNWKFPKNIWYEDYAALPILGLYSKKISYLKDPFYYYMVRTGSIMNQVSYNKKLEDIFEATEFLFNNGKNNKYSSEIEFIIIENFLHDATLRFLDYNTSKKIYVKIALDMRKYYPNYNKNIYFKKMSLKYKIVCKLIYNKKINLLKLLLKKK